MDILLEVGVYGFAFDNRILRVLNGGKVRLNWFYPIGSEREAKIQIAGMIRDRRTQRVLVVNPAREHLIADVLQDLPSHITLVKRAQPFTPDSIDLTPL